MQDPKRQLIGQVTFNRLDKPPCQ